jgi:hypothetical protein
MLRFLCVRSSTFLPVHIVICSDRPSTLWLVVHVHISTTIPRFSHPTMHSTDAHSIFTIESQQLPVNFDGSFIFVGQKLSNISLICFNMVENKPCVLNGIWHTPLCFPSHTAWQTVEQGTVNKLAQGPLQGHTPPAWDTCAEALVSEWPLYLIQFLSCKIQIEVNCYVWFHSQLCIFKLFSFHILFPGKCSVKNVPESSEESVYVFTGITSLPIYSFVLQQLKSLLVVQKLP